MKKERKDLRMIAVGGIIAALYVLLTLLSMSVGLASGMIQVRLSEMLCILPMFTVSSVPGLFCGCIVSNLIGGMGVFDVLLGSLATLLGAVGTRLLRKRPILAIACPILSNTVIVPVVLCIYGVDQAFPLMMLTVCIGEVISCGICGGIMYSVLKKRWNKIFAKKSV
ncbi:MAG: QueT transporter family protein [Clostridia bacterium]|nr:QueT transporter family protein [Clostridia bacterium]